MLVQLGAVNVGASRGNCALVMDVFSFVDVFFIVDPPVRGDCNKHIPVGVLLNGERLIVVHIVIVDYLHSLVGGSLIDIRPEGTKSNR